MKQLREYGKKGAHILQSKPSPTKTISETAKSLKKKQILRHILCEKNHKPIQRSQIAPNYIQILKH